MVKNAKCIIRCLKRAGAPKAAIQKWQKKSDKYSLGTSDGTDEPEPAPGPEPEPEAEPEPEPEPGSCHSFSGADCDEVCTTLITKVDCENCAADSSGNCKDCTNGCWWG